MKNTKTRMVPLKKISELSFFRFVGDECICVYRKLPYIFIETDIDTYSLNVERIIKDPKCKRCSSYGGIEMGTTFELVSEYKKDKK